MHAAATVLRQTKIVKHATTPTVPCSLAKCTQFSLIPHPYQHIFNTSYRYKELQSSNLSLL